MIRGFFGGMGLSNTMLYVGAMTVNNTRRVATIVQAPGGTTTVSVCSAFGNSEICDKFNNASVSFVAAQSTLMWVTAMDATIPGIAGKVEVALRPNSTDKSKHFITRHSMTANYMPYQQIGSYFVDANGTYAKSAFFYNGNAVEYTSGPFEVLVCMS